MKLATSKSIWINLIFKFSIFLAFYLSIAALLLCLLNCFDFFAAIEKLCVHTQYTHWEGDRFILSVPFLLNYPRQLLEQILLYVFTLSSLDKKKMAFHSLLLLMVVVCMCASLMALPLLPFFAFKSKSTRCGVYSHRTHYLSMHLIYVLTLGFRFT